jgi:hypothetical protein
MPRESSRYPAVLFAFVLLAAAASAWSADSAGTIKFASGAVTVARASGAAAASVGERVFPGDRIVTGKDGYVGLMLHDDTRLSLGPSSEMLIKDFRFNLSSYVGDMALALIKGTAMVVTGLIAKQSPDSVTITTPTTTVGIRGTEFIVEVEPEG